MLPSYVLKRMLKMHSRMGEKEHVGAEVWVLLVLDLSRPRHVVGDEVTDVLDDKVAGGEGTRRDDASSLLLRHDDLSGVRKGQVKTSPRLIALVNRTEATWDLSDQRGESREWLRIEPALDGTSNRLLEVG